MVDYSEMYLHNHPQRQTHQPHLLPYTEYSHRVPNFLGGSLPRRDAGDIDNYAATMLTLFKPWRSGIDLKPETQMWTEVFQSFIFSDRYLHLMDNFNLRYECSDARDDFVAQRKLIEKNGKGPAHMPFNNEELNDIDKDNVEEDAMDEVNKYDHPDQEQECQEPFAVIGETAAKHLMQMNTVENLLHEIGWTKTKPITNPTPSNLHHIDHSLNWNSVLDDKKKEILALRADTCTSNPMPTTITPLSPTSLAYIKAFLNQLKNLVRWKTLDYLLQTYSKDEREIIELKSSITSTYSLNKEQERAFKIITNHATCNTTESLQMYLGGMAGTGKSQVLKAVTKFFEDIGQIRSDCIASPYWICCSSNRRINISLISRI